MKRLVLIACFLVATASAQNVQRVVVVPFQGTEGFGSFAIGISAALQRSLNVVDGVYVPPIGDAVLVAERAAAAGLDPSATITELFGADAILEGRLRLRGDAMLLELTLADVTREVPMAADDPARSVALAAGSAFQLLGLQVAGDDRAEFEQVVAQTPSPPSLGPVSLTGSGLPSTGFGGVATAVDLDPESSWVRAEYARSLALQGSLEAAVDEAERAVALAPRDVEAQVVLGVVRGAAGDADGAVEAFEAALELNPDHAVAWVGIGRYATDPVRGVEALERAIASYPRLGEAYVLLADRAGDPAQSIEILRRAGPHLPDSIGIHRRVVARYVSNDQAAAALDYLRATAESPMASSPAVYALAAELPRSVGDAALGFVQEGLSVYPSSATVAEAAARLHLADNRPQEAIDVLRPRVEAGTAEPDVLTTLAIAYARSGDVAAARAVFEGLEDTPANRFNLALALLEAGEAEEAVPIFEALLAASPSAEVRAYYGIALTQVGRVDEGRAQLESALEADPGLTLAERALERLDQRQAVGLGEVALTAEQANAVDRGLLALDEGAYATAVDAFAQARALGDEGVLAFYHGLALQRNGQIRAAVEAYRTAAEGLPGSSVVASNLGYAQLQLGRYDRALDQLRRALELDPQNARAHLNLGLAYYGLSRFRDALEAWNRAEELQPGITDGIANLVEQARNRAP